MFNDLYEAISLGGDSGNTFHGIRRLLHAFEDIMPYGYIVLIAGSALVAWFVLVTDASRIGKAVVSVLYMFSLASIFGWIRVNSLIGIFLLVALGIFIIFYRLYQDATLGK